MFYPPDPGSFEICTIGGNLATSADGMRCAKYGVTRDSVLGPESLAVYQAIKAALDPAGILNPGRSFLTRLAASYTGEPEKRFHGRHCRVGGTGGWRWR